MRGAVPDLILAQNINVTYLYYVLFSSFHGNGTSAEVSHMDCFCEPITIKLLISGYVL